VLSALAAAASFSAAVASAFFAERVEQSLAVAAFTPPLFRRGMEWPEGVIAGI